MTRPTGSLRVGVVDVGGTSMRRARVDVGGSATPVVGEVTGVSVPTSPDAAVRLVLELAAVAGEGADAVGVVLPGLVDDASGTGVWAENIGWRDVPFARLLRERIAVPVAVGHDVRAWGLAETRHGAGRGFSNVAVVPLGTGIAAALMVDGRPLVGRGFAGEIGHLRVTSDEPCVCGGTGCLEAVASAAGIVRQYNRVAARPVTGAVEVADAVRRGDPDASRVWAIAVDRLAEGLAALVSVVAPQALVLGGGLARAGHDLLLGPLSDQLASRLHYSPVPRVLPAAFEGNGGLVGAAVLAADVTATAERRTR